MTICRDLSANFLVDFYVYRNGYWLIFCVLYNIFVSLHVTTAVYLAVYLDSVPVSWPISKGDICHISHALSACQL